MNLQVQHFLQTHILDISWSETIFQNIKTLNKIILRKVIQIWVVEWIYLSSDMGLNFLLLSRTYSVLLQNLNKMCCSVWKFLLAKLFKWKTYFELQLVMKRRIYRCFLVCIYVVVAKTEESYHKTRKIKHLRLFTQSKQGWYYVGGKNCFDEKKWKQNVL